LRDFQSICSVSMENLGEFNINFFEKATNNKFLRTPQLENIDSDDYVNVTFKICQLRVSAATCSPLNKTTDWLSILNVGHEISIRLVHNFTQVTNATMFLIYDPNLDFELATIRQKFTVEFVQATNQTNVYPVSGNLGYLLHKPILVTKLTVNSNGTYDTISSRLEFFEETNQTHFKVPLNRRNYCQLDDNDFDTIKFGENLFLRCNAPLLQNLSSNCITPESNLTDVCQTFQKQLFHYLLNHFEQKTNKTDMSDFNVLISEFGNPKNNTQHWHPFKNRNTWLESIDQIKGTSNNDIALVCHNMMLNVKYDFYYARLTVDSVKHQNLIKNSELEFGPLVNLQFRFDEEFKVPIYIQIQFHDLTSMASLVGDKTKLLLLSCAITLMFVNV
jgi:tectonic-1/3